MLIVERPISYYPPHKHASKGETIQILQGEMAAILFEDDGRIREIHRLQTGGTFLLKLSKDTYHFYMPLTESAIYYESKLGPYCAKDNLFAPWAPSREDRLGGLSFKQSLMTHIDSQKD